MKKEKKSRKSQVRRMFLSCHLSIDKTNCHCAIVRCHLFLFVRKSSSTRDKVLCVVICGFGFNRCTKRERQRNLFENNLLLFGSTPANQFQNKIQSKRKRREWNAYAFVAQSKCCNSKNRTKTRNKNTAYNVQFNLLLFRFANHYIVGNIAVLWFQFSCAQRVPKHTLLAATVKMAIEKIETREKQPTKTHKLKQNQLEAIEIFVVLFNYLLTSALLLKFDRLFYFSWLHLVSVFVGSWQIRN